MNAASPVLCETCGYDLGGLEQASDCPECGRAVWTSLPARRAGSPWQRTQTLRAYAASGVGVLRRPRMSFAQVTIEQDLSMGLVVLNALIAGGCFGGALGVAIGLHTWRMRTPLITAAATALGVALMATIAAALAVGCLTMIEARGVRFWATRHGFRITPVHALAIVGHASFGWVIAGAVAGPALLAVELPPVARTLRDVGLPSGPGRIFAGLPLALAAAAPGLLVFETLTYLGVRACRYANPPDASPSTRAVKHQRAREDSNLRPAV